MSNDANLATINSSYTSLINSLYQIGAVRFGEYILKSGHKTSVYVNLRIIISYPNLLRQIAEVMWAVVANTKFDLICGVPYTALPIATCISLDHNIPMVMRRKEKKDYGTKQMIEGVYRHGQSCLIIEDVITKGLSIIETAEELEKIGLKVNAAIALIDRDQGGKENLKKHHYQITTLLTLPHILNSLMESNLLNESEQNYAKRYLDEKG